MLDRRRFLIGTAAGLMGSLAMPRFGAAGQPLPGIVPLGDRLSLVTTGGTNILALSTPDGLIVIDTGAPELSDRVIDSLRQLAPGGGVRTVFNTHWHHENTGANGLLRQTGATIVAHENTRLWMAAPTWIPAEDRYRPPRPPSDHPSETFYLDGSADVGGEHIDYGYLIEAHTSGDIYVFFRESNVLAAGDVVSPVRDPELDWFTGAWLGGRVDALDRLLALSNPATRIVPGFGPVMTRAALQAERDMMATIYQRAVDRVREADSPDDMLAAGVMDGLPRRWEDPRAFLHAVHKGLWAHHDKLAPNVV